MMKNLKENSIKAEAEEMTDKAKSNISDLSKEIKASTGMVADNIVYKTERAEDEAVNLVENIRQLVTNYANKDRLTAVKSEVVGKAKVVKENVQQGVTTVVEETSTKVREKPIRSVALAAGLGALVGYALAAKKSKSSTLSK